MTREKHCEPTRECPQTLWKYIYTVHACICSCALCDRSIFSDEIVETLEIAGISNPTREDRDQDLCSTGDSFSGVRASLAPRSTLENTKYHSLKIPQGGEEQVQHAAPADNVLPLEGLTSAFIGVGSGAAWTVLHVPEEEKRKNG